MWNVFIIHQKHDESICMYVLNYIIFKTQFFNFLISWKILFIPLYMRDKKKTTHFKCTYDLKTHTDFHVMKSI